MTETFGLSPALQERLLTSIAVILVFWAARRIVLFAALRKVTDPKLRYRWQKATTYVTVPLAILVLGRIWFEGFQSLATFLGLLSAGLAIALKDLLVNLAGWGFILWRRPFEVGDRVQIGPHAGDVIDLRIFQFTLLEIGNWVDADQSTGRIIHIPNGKVFTEPLANFTKGFQFIWNEIPVLVTFESNWEKAKNILLEIARKHGAHLTAEAEAKLREVSSRFMIFYTTLTPTVYTSVADSGVLLTIRYLCDPRQRRGTTQAIWEDILRAFAECDDIDFAYPTQRFYNNAVEGKPEARARPPEIAGEPRTGR
ncbi:MAG: mechanosensitive ion channel protein MscS [Gemmatimonadales bacterium]|nr:MAG: mechanosensitive ion channel protein MscS [Gemmatimonadales bacterium]